MQSSSQKKQLREFGVLIAFGFPIIIGWILPIVSGHIFRIWTLWIGIPSLFIAIVKPTLLKYPYKIWIRIGNILGFINSHIILGAIFFLILFPLSIFMKLTGYDPLKKKNFNTHSYREIRKDDSINLEKIF